MGEAPSGRNCTRCGEWKPLSEFSPHAKGPYGKQCRCKKCSTAANKARYHANIQASRARGREASKLSQIRNRDRRNAQRRAWAERNPDALKESRRKWVETNPERDKAAKLAYFEANRDAVLERGRQWREDNPEKMKAARRAYYEANKEEILRKSREWEKANPEKTRDAKLRYMREQIANGNMRIRVANKRAKKRAAGGSITKADVQEKFAQQTGKCAICRAELIRYEIDHILPVALGGPTTKENIQLLCRPCNRWKWDRHPDEIRGLIPPHVRIPDP